MLGKNQQLCGAPSRDAHAFETQKAIAKDKKWQYFKDILEMPMSIVYGLHTTKSKRLGSISRKSRAAAHPVPRMHIRGRLVDRGTSNVTLFVTESADICVPPEFPALATMRFHAEWTKI
jgi:hypothetical protein